MSANPFNLIEWLNWLLKKYQEIQQQTNMPDAFRIIDITYNKSHKCAIKVQVIGKTSIFECTPEKIVSDHKLLERFSKKDIHFITYLATQEIKEAKYKILIQKMSEENKMIFKIVAPNLSEPIEKTADQISLDKDLINKLSAQDAHLIGFTTALEQVTREKEELERLKTLTNYIPAV